MPPLGLSAAEARDLAAYVLTTPLTQAKAPALDKRLPHLKRRVAFDEVNEKVLSKTCRHCHGNPDIAGGDGGPGHTGGFGFPARKLDLSSYSGISSGMVRDDGERHSIFRPLKDGTPRIVAALMARRGEQQGRINPAVRGMPLGLPALSLQDIQLLDTWIQQGRPR